MQKAENNRSETQGTSASFAGKGRRQDRAAWYAGPYKDALIYLMVAIFFIEMIVGGISFFYGVMHAAPDVPGGPPLARFPWFGWAVAAVLAPVGLILIVHLSGTWVSRYLGREDGMQGGRGNDGQPLDDEQVPERLRRFYAIIRNTPTVVLLLGIMLLGAGLFFVDGAFSAMVRLGGALAEYIPWIAGSLAALVAVCYLVHRWFVYRHHRMQQEYAYRREVLERTGIVLVDKGCIPLPQNEVQRLALGGQVVEAQALPALDAEAGAGEAAVGRNGAAGHDDDVTDAEIISPDAAASSESAAGSGDAARADSADSAADASHPVEAPSAADAEKPRRQG